VYAITSPVTGNVKMKLEADYPALLGSRGTCTDPMTERSCASKPSPGLMTAFVPLAAGATTYVFVDGVGGSYGHFTLSMEQTATYCGDGTADSPEQCDDGNTTDGDGCSSVCALESKVKADSCPAPIYSFSGTGTAPRKISIAGDTTGAINDVNTSICTGASLGPDQIYQLVPDMTGSLSVELRAGYLNSGVYLRRECGNATDSKYDVDCAVSKTLAPARFTAPVTKGVPVWLVVDGSNATAYGPYTVDVTLSAPVCGNGILDGGEICDDGNTTNGDGCKSDCTLETTSGNKCADAEVLTPADKGDGTYAISRTGSTVGLTNDFTKIGCEWSGTNGSPDAVYAVTAPIDGLLSATLDPTFAAQLQVRTACVDGTNGTSDSCKLTTGTGPVTQTWPVVAGNTYYVIVDGPSNSLPTQGSFELDVSVKPGTCGNGVIEGAEQCDDGGTAAGDGCDASCKLEVTTDGSACLTPKVVTLADDGSGLYSGTLTYGTTAMKALKSFSVACPSAGREAFIKVTAPIDGNLVAKVSGAPFDVTIGARSSCTPDTGDTNRLACSASVKGVGNEQFGFPVVAGKDYILVVDGATATDFGRFDLNVSVAAPRCGDLVAGSGEDCDDGNTTSGDGCSSTCKAEPITGVDTCPGAPLTLVGSGTAPRTATVKMSTSILTADYASSCGGNSRDGVFKIVPDVSGELEVQLSGVFNTTLYARSTCDKVTSELACASTNDSTTGTRLMRIPAAAKVPVYVFVDGRDGESGFATLSVKLTP
jgi:cysteine-rich repeat protein